MLEIKLKYYDKDAKKLVVIKDNKKNVYPSLKILKIKDSIVVVLFTDTNTGTCLVSTYSEVEVGEYSPAWTESFFQEIEAPVKLTISNI